LERKRCTRIHLQKQYKDGIITEDDMTLDEINALIKLYINQNKELRDTLSKKLIQKSREW
jgi:hypothetical protein